VPMSVAAVTWSSAKPKMAVATRSPHTLTCGTLSDGNGNCVHTWLAGEKKGSHKKAHPSTQPDVILMTYGARRGKLTTTSLCI